ncbi:MAG: response regulator transcription factor [Bacteroidota bacterium]|nr:response regulator transcription factor [Bacteroidota bacterium]
MWFEPTNPFMNSANKKRILFADDEETIRQLVKINLEEEGYYVAAVDNGLKAIHRFKEEKFDLIILDIMMPEMDGLTACENIRLQDNKIPILILSARDAGEDRVKGLKLGADDYLSKPFNLEELLLRVSKLIARAENMPKKPSFNEYSFGDNYVNFETYEAKGEHGEFKLTKKEALLLKLMIDHKGAVVSREKILQTVWGYSVFPSTRTIDNFVLSFRKYFEKDQKNPVFFHSLRGVGYKFMDGSK